MKIIQVNAWMGNLLYPLLDFVKEQAPDIVCMQEVFSSDLTVGFDAARFKVLEAFQELFPYSFFAPTSSFEYVSQSVKHGNAIFSKHRIGGKQTTFVNGTYTDLTKDSFDYNIRNLQSCTVELAGRPVSIVNHHGYHQLSDTGNAKSVECMRIVVDHLKTIKNPLILCGDLNVAPHSEPIRLIEQALDLNNHVTLNDVKTTLSDVFRVKDLKVVCDYIFTSKDITINRFTVSDQIVSDHKALILEFDV